MKVNISVTWMVWVWTKSFPLKKNTASSFPHLAGDSANVATLPRALLVTSSCSSTFMGIYRVPTQCHVFKGLLAINVPQ